MSGTGIFAMEYDALDSFVQIGVANGRVISLSFPDTPEPDAAPEHEILDWIEGYLLGRHTDVTEIPIGLTVPTGERAALERVRQIPYGKELTLERLVSRGPSLDPVDDDDFATARRALTENPIPLLVPDHRVSDGPSGAPSEIEAIFRDIEGL